jgi:hypothetical protein
VNAPVGWELRLEINDDLGGARCAARRPPSASVRRLEGGAARKGVAEGTAPRPFDTIRGATHALTPMRLLRLPEPFDHPDFEPTLDGFRALAHVPAVTFMWFSKGDGDRVFGIAGDL